MNAAFEGPEPARAPGDAEHGRRLADAANPPVHWWRPVLVLVLLSLIVATIAVVGQQWTVSRASNGVPDEGYYWSVAQYQIAHHRLKQELRAIAAGEPADLEELGRRAAVLSSKASILSEPSEVKRLFDNVPGYAEATQQVADMLRRIGPTLDKQPFKRADAVKILAEFKAMDDDETLSRLANDVRLAELGAKDGLMSSLTRRIHLAWGGFALCWLALALWLLTVVHSRRRYRMAANDRQRAVEAMERAVVAKRKFLSMVSHEVRSPLQNIVAAAELLALKEPRPECITAIRRIQRAVSVLQGQLRDLLTLARDDTGQRALQAETVELGQLVRDVCSDLEEAAHAKGLTFLVQVPDAAVTLFVDPIRIAQVLRNLVENSVRYTAAGTITVRLDPFEPGAPSPALAGRSAGAGSIRLVISDTGPGLPLPALQRLKGAMLPAEPGSEGSGIGLFVIRDVLQQLGGDIDVSIGGRRGSTFTVSIPAILAEETPGEPANSESLNILIVDDRSDVLAALGDVTHRLGHACDTAASADAAQQLLGGKHYDAVLIDLEMPGQDGLVLATAIRHGDAPNKDAMLILISAAENRAVGLAWPFDGFLQKPIDGTALSRLLGRGEQAIDRPAADEATAL